MNNWRFLSFDFGLKRIGVAAGQFVTGSASPLDPLKARNGQCDWQIVDALIAEWKPHALIVGLPLNMDGSSSEMSARANKFRKRLHGRYGLPAYAQDERLSSNEAKAIVRERDPRISDFGQFSVDSIAAALIFEQWYQLNSDIEKLVHPE